MNFLRSFGWWRWPLVVASHWGAEAIRFSRQGPAALPGGAPWPTIQVVESPVCALERFRVGEPKEPLFAGLLFRSRHCRIEIPYFCSLLDRTRHVHKMSGRKERFVEWYVLVVPGGAFVAQVGAGWWRMCLQGAGPLMASDLGSWHAVLPAPARSEVEGSEHTADRPMKRHTARSSRTTTGITPRPERAGLCQHRHPD
jgi:hypothetical protein